MSPLQLLEPQVGVAADRAELLLELLHQPPAILIGTPQPLGLLMRAVISVDLRDNRIAVGALDAEVLRQVVQQRPRVPLHRLDGLLNSGQDVGDGVWIRSAENLDEHDDGHKHEHAS